MTSTPLSTKKLTVFKLTWPIFIETLLFMLLGSVDTLMLSRYSDNAVAAVGVSNQLITMMNIMFGILSTGTSVLIAQNLGAGNKKMASKVATVSLIINCIFGLFLSLIMFLAAHGILSTMGIRPELMSFAAEYLKIVGGCLFLQSVMMTCTAIVRSHGLTKISMLVTLGINIVHVILDYIFIFGPLNLPVLGVRGVAISTNISKLLGLIIMLYVVFKNVGHGISIKNITPFPKNIVRDLLKIGIPTAGEHFSYNLSQLVITYFINFLGNEALTTKAYVQNIVMFAYLFSVAIGEGTEILVGHLVGADETEKAYKTCLKSLRLALIISFSIGTLFALLRTPVLSIFTDNPSILIVGGTVLIIDAILEPGRSFNVVVINSLRAAGDVKFPVYMGILSMWGVSVTLSYIFGIKMGFGLAGMWVAFACDEWFRGILMLWRWRTKKWQSMAFVKKPA
ncbi:MATE family efflux transporter [Clostridium sp. 'White wine YQ']|uniref:MATE family efflux transporter n=1 Tax=Clostridium sp. 'White wine YQ' TaxID=3027474 RepID=UPI0023665569|nr:MATE family efflux transporter [Clostridium sp. 'White wine YQ']MDD7795272.1 MATE family efflux transporter [Clostridium sp. 'White wine YQ']